MTKIKEGSFCSVAYWF